MSLWKISWHQILISAGEEFTATTRAGTLHWPQGPSHQHQLDHHHHDDHLDHVREGHHHKLSVPKSIKSNDNWIHHFNVFYSYSQGNSCILQRHPGYRARGEIIFSSSNLMYQEADMIFLIQFMIFHPSEGERLLFHWWEQSCLLWQIHFQ